MYARGLLGNLPACLSSHEGDTSIEAEQTEQSKRGMKGRGGRGGIMPVSCVSIHTYMRIQPHIGDTRVYRQVGRLGLVGEAGTENRGNGSQIAGRDGIRIAGLAGWLARRRGTRGGTNAYIDRSKAHRGQTAERVSDGGDLFNTLCLPEASKTFFNVIQGK